MVEGAGEAAGTDSPAVFVSYASQDGALAHVVVGALERAGSKCWIAPRDVVPGALYADEIVRAINESSLVVLVLSAQSVASSHVGKELERASSKRRRIIALRTDAAPLPRAFEYFLSESQWIEVGAGGIEPAAAKLAGAVRRHLGSGPAVEPIAAPADRLPQSQVPPLRWSRNRVGLTALAILAVLLVAGGTQWARTREHGSSSAVDSGVATASARTSASATSRQGTSLAVLPFADMSPQHDQEYFSDGLSEELLNQLAQIKDLKVAGRTSSFSFKGKNDDLRVIGQKLGVNHLLEGSVRKDGTQLRITAQLIDATTGVHILSRTYDTKLESVFSVQENIAKDVAVALSIALDVGEMSRAKGGTNDLDAYDKYLRARDFFNQGGPDNWQRSVQLFHEAVALDPNFALAWDGLHRALEQTLIFVPENAAAVSKEMHDVMARIVALTPDAWWTQAVRASQATRNQQWAVAETASAAALASAPSTANVALSYGVILQELGRINEGLEHIQRARQTDPLSLAVSFSLQMALDTAGRLDEAQAEYERSKDLVGNHASADNLALRRLLMRENPDVAAVRVTFRNYLQATRQTSIFGLTPDNFTNKQAVLTALHQQFDDPARQVGNFMVLTAWVADRYGDKDLALAAFRRGFIDLHASAYLSFWPVNETRLHTDPRFKQLVRDLGFADYFRSAGKWNDFCRPVGTDDFECR